MHGLAPSDCCESTGIHPSSQGFQVFLNCGFAVAQCAELKPLILSIRCVGVRRTRTETRSTEGVWGAGGEGTGLF